MDTGFFDQSLRPLRVHSNLSNPRTLKLGTKVRALGGEGIREKPRWMIFGAKFELKVSNQHFKHFIAL
jgi:hypothetical protein